MVEHITRSELATLLRQWADDVESDMVRTRTGVLVPLYIRPGPEWERLEAAKKARPRVPIVAIANPGDGPGSSRSSTYVSAIQKLSDGGVPVIGYVTTDYMNRPLDTVKEQVRRWKDWYPAASGVFLDEVVSKASPQAIDYYTAAETEASRVGLHLVVGNPGTTPEPGMFDTADVMVVHETSSSPSVDKLRELEAKGGKGRMAVLVYGVGAGVVESLVPATRGLVSHIYVTPDVLPNPWNTLTPYLERTLELLDAE